jgi:caa(3)-type oxidase subunit IV
MVDETQNKETPSHDTDHTTDERPAEVENRTDIPTEDKEDVAVTPDYDPQGEAQQLDPENIFEEGVANAMAIAADAEDNPAVQQVNEEITTFMQETAVIADRDESLLGDHAHSDTFTLPFTGEQMTLPGGIYTFIFGVLAALTLFEVIWAEIIPDSWTFFKVSVLVIASLGKAYLVVMYYMHLNNDNPIFRVVLLLPLIIVALSVLYLVGVPVDGGMGYQPLS